MYLIFPVIVCDYDNDKKQDTKSVLERPILYLLSFFALGRILGYFCNVLLQITVVLKQNIAEISQDASQDKKLDTKPLL